MTKLMCPTCPNDEPDLVPFLDEDGQGKLDLICRAPVHQPGPLHIVYADPNAPKLVTGNPGSAKAVVALVHELELYPKLIEVVTELSARMRQPVEYGIVEHHLAFAYPHTYRDLGERFGHRAVQSGLTHTLSAYVGLLLGNLARKDELRYWPSRGTGYWHYDSDISAWSTLDIDEGSVVLSWKAFADTQVRSGDPLFEHGDEWPAKRLLADLPV
jgi:hypothetical protein